MSDVSIRTLILEYMGANGASHIREMHIEMMIPAGGVTIWRGMLDLQAKVWIIRAPMAQLTMLMQVYGSTHTAHRPAEPCTILLAIRMVMKMGIVAVVGLAGIR